MHVISFETSHAVPSSKWQVTPIGTITIGGVYTTTSYVNNALCQSLANLPALPAMILLAATCIPISFRALASLSHEVSVSYSSQVLIISCLCRPTPCTLQLISISLSVWSGKPSFIPRVCQSTTSMSILSMFWTVRGVSVGANILDVN